MINITSNIAEVTQRITIQLSALADKDKLLRGLAAGILPVVKTRVHEQGLDATESPIGTYSPGYMKVRTGDFNSPVITRGKKKGEVRPNYNRSRDTKVIGSLTRQMENDLSVIETPDGYGLGYKNEFNFQKSQWLEETYKKKIWQLTPTELSMVGEYAAEYSTRELNG
jgi:hypothetical protein